MFNSKIKPEEIEMDDRVISATNLYVSAKSALLRHINAKSEEGMNEVGCRLMEKFHDAARDRHHAVARCVEELLSR